MSEKQKLEFQTILVLSTGHVTKECAAMLDDTGGPCGMMKWEYGWLVWVGNDDNDPEHEHECASLAPCLQLARKHGAAWVRFDCDGPIVEGLEVFEW